MAILISILSLLLSLIYVLVLSFLKKGWIALPDFVYADHSAKTLVSVIVAARNEEDNIARTIEDILAQDYPSQLMELIVIDDHSTDQTAAIIASYADRGVRLIELNENEPLNSYKKKAIATAIDGASGDLIVTTDADCRMGQRWLSSVVSFFEQGNYHMVSSPVVYFEEKSFFERLQTLEFLFLIGLGAAGIGNKMPSTCNGANLAYRKKTFYAVGGFSGIDQLASGDDELLLHKIAEKFPNRIGFCKSYDAVVYTDAKPTLKSFLQQRRRWASKSTRYKDKKIIALAVAIWLYNLSALGMLVAAIFEPAFLLPAILQLLIKFLMELVFLKPILRFAKRKELLAYLPVLTVAHIFYFLYIGVAGNSGKYVWKGRKVR